MRFASILLLLFLSITLNAANKDSKKADAAFANGDYLTAIDWYNVAIESENDASERALYKYRIGESYYRLNRPDRAEKNLSDAIKQGYMPSEAYLMLGDVQLKLGKPDDALSSFEAYRLANPGDPSISVKIASVQFAKENSQNVSLFNLDYLTRINSRQNDFGVSYFNESLIFSTTRTSAIGMDDEEDSPKERDKYEERVVPDKKSKKSYTKSGLNQTTVMHSVGRDGNYNRPIEIAELKKMKDFANDGIMIYDPYSKKAYYTTIDGKKAYIHSLELSNNQWKKSEKIEVQSQGEPIGHPFMTPEGDRIYFTSTMPGGKGKSDIWYISRAGNGWSTPVNAGDINTAGNEVYPFICDGYFFFASDGRIGIGGLDIYASKITGSGFGAPINLGAPFNSPADDYNLVIRVDKKEGMLVSSRNPRSGDDIYRFEGFPSNLKIIGKAYDMNSRMPISNVSLEIFQENKSLGKFVSDQNGDFVIPVRPNVTYRLVATVPGYASSEKTFKSPNELFMRVGKESGVDLDFALQSNASVISGKVYDIQTSAPIVSAVVSLIANGKVEQTVKTDPSGIYKFANLTNSTNYTVRLDPDGYFIEHKGLNVGNTGQKMEYNKANGYDMDFSLQKYDLNKEIIIPNIYFQESKANILTESYAELDRIANLFNQNQHCRILLKGYVDVKVKADIANTLSTHRVNAVRDYLLAKKVNPSQISTRGMGKQNPLVRTPINDDERQLNNRITYTVTRVDAVKELEYLTPKTNSNPVNSGNNRPQTNNNRPQTGNQGNTQNQNTQRPGNTQQNIQQPQQTVDPTQLPYIVQVSSSGALDLNKDDFKKIKTQLGLEVRYIMVSGSYKYYVGGFSTLTEAKDIAQKLESIGIKGAWARSKY